MRSPRYPRQNAIEHAKVGGEPTKGVIWALVFIGDQLERLITATLQSTDLNREVWEDEKRRSSDVS